MTKEVMLYESFVLTLYFVYYTKLNSYIILVELFIRSTLYIQYGDLYEYVYILLSEIRAKHKLRDVDKWLVLLYNLSYD